MKIIILFLSLLIISKSGISQNIPNGDFDDVVINTNNPFMTYPVNWMPYHWLLWYECYPNLIQGEITTESYSGDYAIKMETIGCFELDIEWIHRPGGFNTGNSGVWSPEGWSLPYNNRPDELNFYYKFHQENFDSAYVEVMLFNYDTTSGIPSSERVDTIAFNSARIFEETEEYVPFTLPINYLTDSVPSFISIVFSSGEKNNCTLATCTPGTTLWVDDVSVSGGDVGIGEIESFSKKFSLYPNPSSHTFRLVSKGNIQIERVSVFDYLGRELKYWIGFQEEYVVSELLSGTYFIRIETAEGVAVKKLMKTD